MARKYALPRNNGSKKKQPFLEGDALGVRIRKARVLKHLTQVGLSELVGIGQGHISQIETGARRDITAQLLHRISVALAVPMEAFLQGETHAS
jgi:transcriptional regulator with XRE-family HTH domain